VVVDILRLPLVGWEEQFAGVLAPAQTVQQNRQMSAADEVAASASSMPFQIVHKRLVIVMPIQEREAVMDQGLGHILPGLRVFPGPPSCGLHRMVGDAEINGDLREVTAHLEIDQVIVITNPA